MSKAVVYLLLATATLSFIIVRSATNNEGKKGGLNRRFGYKILERAPIFDPIVTTIEREAEFKKQQKFDDNKTVVRRTGLGSTTSVGEVSETYQYLTSGESWIIQRAMERLDYTTQVELDSMDMNGDSAVSFKEYLPHLSQRVDLEDVEGLKRASIKDN
ncbi:hypothetical protein TSUD_10440 [Trifolium subterraneum]|nr:hypothetical protein TSUD_10440 [Trifolium subterraneum]